MLSSDMPLLASVFVAGLIGSASHCSVMCSPLVAAQMLQQHESNRPQSQMALYHAGRITTYVALALIAYSMGSLIFSGGLSGLTNAMLMLAGATFIISAAFPRKTHSCCDSKTQKLSRYLENALPAPLALFLRGGLMGFMPCGMIIAILMTISTVSSPLSAVVLMAAFGLSTVPMLQLAGLGALKLNRHFPHATILAGRGVMALNGLFLCALGANMISIA